MKKIMPICDQPSVITCIHHAYPCAIIESKQLAKLSAPHEDWSKWDVKAINTEVQIEDSISFFEKDSEVQNASICLWRKSNEIENVIVNLEYIKMRSNEIYVDLFFSSEEKIVEEIKKEDKTFAIRWNQYGFFKRKEMFNYNANKYKYIKLQKKNSRCNFYISKDNIDWIWLFDIRLDYNQPNSTECLGIHLYFGTDSYREWKYMNFIQLIYNASDMYKGICLDYYFFPRKNYDNSFGYYINYLDTHYDLLSDALSCYNSVVDYLRWNLQHDYYVNICLDEFFVPKRKKYGICHYNHYNLFYGFDDDNREFHIMGYSAEGKPVISEISYETFSKEIVTSENLVRYKYAINTVSKSVFEISCVISGLDELLHSIDSSKKHANLMSEENVIFGIKGIREMAENDVGRWNVKHDKRVAYCLIEHSKMMKERVMYLVNHKYINKGELAGLISKCDKVINLCSQLLCLILKNMIKEVSQDRIDGLIIDIYNYEKELIQGILFSLTKREY